MVSIDEPHTSAHARRCARTSLADHCSGPGGVDSWAALSPREADESSSGAPSSMAVSCFGVSLVATVSRCHIWSRPMRGRSGSGSLRALGLDVHAVERAACGHEQPVLLQPPEADVRTGLRKVNLAEELAFWAVAVHAVEAGSAPPRSSPQVAGAVGTDPVEAALRHERPPVDRAGRVHVVDPDLAEVHDVQERLVG